MSSTETMKNWAMLLEDTEDIPVAFKEAFEEVLSENFITYTKGFDTFPYTILLPDIQNSQTMISLVGRAVYVFEKKESVHTYAINKRNFNYLEVGKVLLYSWININLIDLPNIHLKMRFNAASEFMFDPIIKKIRSFYISPYQTEASIQSAAKPSGLECFKSLKTENYKLVNYAKDCIMPNQKVLDYLYQPAVYTHMLPASQKLLLHAHISVLTDKEWIFIRDGAVLPRGFAKTPHGGVWYYIPLSRITRIMIIPEDDDKITQQVILSNDEIVEYTYYETLKDKVNTFTEKINGCYAG